MKTPAFQFYPDDFIGGTMDMSQAEVGAYIRLLCYQWGKGHLPNNKEKLERIACGPVTDDVISKFEPHLDGHLRNIRLELVRAEQTAYRESQSNNGKIGANLRWEREKALKKLLLNDGDPTGGAIATPLATPLANGSPNDGSPVSRLPSPVSLPGLQFPDSNADGAQSAHAPDDEGSRNGSGQSRVKRERTEAARRILEALNRTSGRQYRPTDTNLGFIVARLAEGDPVDEAGCIKMIERQCAFWKGSKMAEYLRPETLFGKTTFDRYYSGRDEPVNMSEPRKIGRRETSTPSDNAF